MVERNDEMSKFVILNSHQWRKCHKETCCCAGNYVLLRGHGFVGEFNTEKEAEEARKENEILTSCQNNWKTSYESVIAEAKKLRG